MNTLLTTLEFLSPFSFAVAMLIVIPLAIHLLNPRKERIIRVGNIDFFRSGSVKKLNQLKLRKLFLLFIRTLMILLLATILAQPYSQLPSNSNNRTHYYFSHNWLKHADESNRLLVRSLVENKDSNSQSTINHKMEKGFKENRFVLLEDFTKDFSSFVQLTDYANKKNETSIQPFSLQNNLHRLFSRAVEADNNYIFITNRASGFDAKLPKTSLHGNFTLNILELENEIKPREISVAIHLMSDESVLRDTLSASFAVLNELSNISINASFEIASDNSTINYGKYDLNVIHITSSKLATMNDNSLIAKQVGNRLIFEGSNNSPQLWKSADPEELLIILSNLLDSSNSLNKNEVAAVDLQDFEPNDSFLPLVVRRNPLDEYLVLLFCLLWIVERWIVIGSSKAKAGAHG